MLETAPLVSAIIPAYNGENYLKEAIESILSQTYANYEIWVINNGSTDRTEEICQSYPQVNYRYSDKADTALARNQGLALARGEYIAYLDQDDTWEREKLMKQVRFLEEGKEYGAVIGWQKMYLEKGHVKPHWLKQDFLDKPQIAYLPSALMVRKRTFSTTDFFDIRLPFASDIAWFLKAKHSGIKIGILNEVVVHRRIHSDNASNKCALVQKEILMALKYSLSERRTSIHG